MRRKKLWRVWAKALGSERPNLAPDAIRVAQAEIDAAHANAEPAFLDLVRRVARNIEAYQAHIKHRDPAPLVRDGRTLGVRYTR